MMEEKELLELIRQGEGQSLDFKDGRIRLMIFFSGILALRMCQNLINSFA